MSSMPPGVLSKLAGVFVKGRGQAPFTTGRPRVGGLKGSRVSWFSVTESDIF